MNTMAIRLYILKYMMWMQKAWVTISLDLRVPSKWQLNYSFARGKASRTVSYCHEMQLRIYNNQVFQSTFHKIFTWFTCASSLNLTITSIPGMGRGGVSKTFASSKIERMLIIFCWSWGRRHCVAHFRVFFFWIWLLMLCSYLPNSFFVSNTLHCHIQKA